MFRNVTTGVSGFQLGSEDLTVWLLSFRVRPRDANTIDIEGSGSNSLKDKYQNVFGGLSVMPLNAINSHVVLEANGLKT